MTGSHRHGWAVFAAMGVLFFAGVTTAYWTESKGNPLLNGVDQNVSAMQPGANMEGKKARFGVANPALFATVPTAASCEESGISNAETDFLASHVAARLHRGDVLVHAVQQRIAFGLGPIRGSHAGEK